MSDQRPEPIGVVLAGGRGRRIGGAKAVAELAGRPLISYPVQAMRGALTDVAVIAKPDTALPPLPDVEIWIEPVQPRHPLVGILHALGMARGRPVLVCPADLPFITAEALARLAAADPGEAPAVIATSSDGALQPLLGCYQARAARLLEPAAREATQPVRAAVAALKPRLMVIEPSVLLFNVNSPDDLRRAENLISQT
jgi:molybdopterin-guanine dinucleotide biosynthesis protein A